MNTCTSMYSPWLQLVSMWLEVRKRPGFPSLIRWEHRVWQQRPWAGSLGKARCGVPYCILSAGYCTWKWKSSPLQEAFPLLFHMAQQHVKDTACHCKNRRWGWELQVRQRKGGDSYLTWSQSGNRIISVIPLCKLPKWNCLMWNTCRVVWLP